MNSVLQSTLQPAFAWVWNTSLAVAVLIALVLLITFAFQKFLPPRWRYALWLLVVLRMLMPAVPSTRWSVFNLGPGLAFPSEHGFPTSPPRMEEFHESLLRQPAIVTELQVQEESASSPQPSPSLGEGEGGERRPLWARQQDTRTFWQVLLDGVSILWLLGAVGYFLAVLFQHRKLSSSLRNQKPIASPRLNQILQEAKGQIDLRKKVSVIEGDPLQTPSVFGFLRPRILLSSAMLEQLGDQELRLVILHELIHIQRRDVLLNWLLILLQALHWFNPFVWLAMRRLRSDHELVCDAFVLGHLAPDDRRAYGATLIKMLESFSKSPPVPSLVPILNHKHEIHRRITMIAQFKPTARLVTLASALLLLALGCLTFTTAAEKPLLPPAEVPKGDADLVKQRDSTARGIKILEEEFSRRDDEVKRLQRDVDKLRADLQISDQADAGQAGRGQSANDLDPLRRLEVLRVEAQAEFIQMDTLYSHLSQLERPKLKKALPTVVPDQVLGELLSRQTLCEEEMAKLLVTYGADHIEVKKTRAVLETTTKQIDERFEGILFGLKAKLDSQKARLDALQGERDKAKESDAEMASKHRPYYQAKRDLESLQFIREKLMMRIFQEKIDAAILK